MAAIKDDSNKNCDQRINETVNELDQRIRSYWNPVGLSQIDLLPLLHLRK